MRRNMISLGVEWFKVWPRWRVGIWLVARNEPTWQWAFAGTSGRVVTNPAVPRAPPVSNRRDAPGIHRGPNVTTMSGTTRSVSVRGCECVFVCECGCVFVGGCECVFDVFKSHCFQGPKFGKFHKYDVLERHFFIAFQTIPLHHNLIPWCAAVSAFTTVCYFTLRRGLTPARAPQALFSPTSTTRPWHRHQDPQALQPAEERRNPPTACRLPPALLPQSKTSVLSTESRIPFGSKRSVCNWCMNAKNVLCCAVECSGFVFWRREKKWG